LIGIWLNFHIQAFAGAADGRRLWSRLAYGHERHAIDGVSYALSGMESLPRNLRDGEDDSASPIQDGGEVVDETGGMRHAFARPRYTMSRATWRWAGIGMAFVMGVWFGTKLAGDLAPPSSLWLPAPDYLFTTLGNLISSPAWTLVHSWAG